MLAHWDDAPARRFGVGPLRLTRIEIGEAIGSDRVGVALLALDPGGRSSPVHVHLADEEIFFVLRGSGLLWQEENAEGALALRAAAVSERWEETMAWVREELGRDRQLVWQWVAPEMPAELKADVPIKPPMPQKAVA